MEPIKREDCDLTIAVYSSKNNDSPFRTVEYYIKGIGGNVCAVHESKSLKDILKEISRRIISLQTLAEKYSDD